MIDALPKERRERVDARYRELKDEVESLRELRKAVGKAQAEIAASLKIKQPSISKIEKQTDMYLSTLRSYVEAMGGELDLIVRLPSRRAPTSWSSRETARARRWRSPRSGGRAGWCPRSCGGASTG